MGNYVLHSIIYDMYTRTGRCKEGPKERNTHTQTKRERKSVALWNHLLFSTYIDVYSSMPTDQASVFRQLYVWGPEARAGVGKGVQELLWCSRGRGHSRIMVGLWSKVSTCWYVSAVLSPWQSQKNTFKAEIEARRKSHTPQTLCVCEGSSTCIRFPRTKYIHNRSKI